MRYPKTKPCRHWREEFPAGPFTFLVSSYNALHSNCMKAQSDLDPSFGVYLDELWDDVYTSYPKIVVHWPDNGVIGLPELNQLISKIEFLLIQGLIIDIACVLGHGRTGTFLACLLVELEGMNATEAIVAVRDRYCAYAVETTEGENLIAAYAKSREGPKSLN